MKSWMSFLLSNDEYKRLKMLHFYAEGGVLLFIAMLVLFLTNDYFGLGPDVIVLLGMMVFIFYVSTRYMFAGIEYPDMTSEKSYRKEVRVTLMRSVTFLGIFSGFYLLLVDIPTTAEAWIDLAGIAIITSVVMFVSTFISLKRSYKKNRELL
ncbi:hypothetical protein [Salimicrobium halophilum]|uniref:DUF3278 domain-containing protein n=1 Tax=Salimicrobium halophilum TaxID=86666 RepID=A0A1G8RDM4_9BACI|nr:hypothetical protein [Salimicrobium halophilum]SDJ15076.1 hypothetical protein SAMN04490247_0970 [Salimicrobium halophilum]